MILPAPTDDTPTAVMLRGLHPGWGWCLRCGMPWPVVDSHETQINEHSGCFPLCKGCWRTLGCAEARIVYYGMLLDAWTAGGTPASAEDRRSLCRAVANGG